MRIDERYEIIVSRERLTFNDFLLLEEGYDDDNIIGSIKRVLDIASAWLYDTVKDRYVSRPIAKEILYSQSIDLIAPITKDVMDKINSAIELDNMLRRTDE